METTLKTLITKMMESNKDYEKEISKKLLSGKEYKEFIHSEFFYNEYVFKGFLHEDSTISLSPFLSFFKKEALERLCSCGIIIITDLSVERNGYSDNITPIYKVNENYGKE
jgi:hypothetical protein